ACCPRPALGKTTLAYLARGLSIERRTGEVGNAGAAKASWMARTVGISLRSVKAARRELIEGGFISKDTGSFQWKLNRDGAYFRINLSWSWNEVPKRCAPEKFSPRSAKTHPAFAPPYKDRKTSYESKTQKTESCALKLPGVCKAN